MAEEEKFYKAKAIQLFQKHVLNQQQIEPSSMGFHIEQAPGLTNITFLLNCKKIRKSACIKFFKNPITQYNVQVEHAYAKLLSEQNLYPKIFLQQKSFRIEELVFSQNATIFDLRNPYIMKEISKKICRIHYNSKIKDKLDQLKSVPFLDWNSFKQSWIKPYEKIHLIVTKEIEHGQLSSQKEFYLKCLSSFQFVFDDKFEQFYKMKLLLPSGDATFLPCHNDVQENNILIHQHDKSKITLIDFDYSGYNYPAFDIANYSIECELDNNYGEYPFIAYYKQNQMKQSEEMEMVKHYIEEKRKILEEMKNDCQNFNFDEQVEKFYKEVQNIKPVVHLFWGVCALATIPQQDYFGQIFNYHIALGRAQRYEQCLRKLQIEGI